MISISSHQFVNSLNIIDINILSIKRKKTTILQLNRNLKNSRVHCIIVYLLADLGKEVKKYMDNGSFVPDDTMISLIGEEIESVADRNWLLDGE